MHHGFTVNAGHFMPCYYFYPTCGIVTGRNNEKIFGSYKNKKQYAKFLRLYSKKDIILVTENWKKVTCKDCLKLHPKSAENKLKRKETKKLKNKISIIDRIIKKYQIEWNILRSKLYKIEESK